MGAAPPGEKAWARHKGALIPVVVVKVGRRAATVRTLRGGGKQWKVPLRDLLGDKEAQAIRAAAEP